VNNIIVRHIGTALLAFLSTWFLVPIMIAMAHRWNILDAPDGRIKVHKTPTPYLGGVAVYLGFISTLAFFAPLTSSMLSLILGSTVLLFIGLIDDLIPMRPWQKFFGQCFVVICFLRYGVQLKGVFFSTTLNLFISGFWMLTVINAFNLVDIMDGLATTLALFSSLGFLSVALLMQNYLLSLFFTALSAALIGFLLYNRPPAKIYLGDAGSLFIGGILATAPLFFSWSESTIYGYLTPIFILAIPLLEVTSLVIIRSYLGIPFYKGSPHHFALYLQKKGYTKKTILAFVAACASVITTIAILFMQGHISFGLLILLAFLFLIFWMKCIFF